MEKEEKLKNTLTFAFVGRSGSGKGTQAEKILAHLGHDAYRVRTGDFFRTLGAKNHATARLVKHIMEKGLLAPWWLPAFVWMKDLIEDGKGAEHMIFDGSPRRIGEAKLLDEVMEWHGRSLPLCIYVDVPEKEVIARLLMRKRSDDNMRAIHNRMKYFSRDVMPVIHYYKARRRLIHVDGAKSVEAVWRDINQALSKRLGSLWIK